MEGRYARALEEKILLEHELQDRVALEEDMQRLRDELRGLSNQLFVLLVAEYVNSIRGLRRIYYFERPERTSLRTACSP